MTPLFLALLCLIILVILILIRVPVAVALGLVGYFGYASLDGFTRAGLALGSAPIELAQAYTFSVVPLFTFMGGVAAVSGFSKDLFGAANAMLRGTRGSLSVASIFASGMFGAICGSSVATALTMSRVSIPEMLKAGYKPSLAAGAVAAGGTLGILIPPSLILMIYAIIAQLSITELFAAALIPGIILIILYSIVALFISRTAAPQVTQAPPAILPALGKIWHVALLFLVTIGGMYGGFFTPTEAAAVGAFGAILLALLTRATDMSLLGKTAIETVRLVSSVIFIVMASTIFSYFIVQTGLSNAISDQLQNAGFSGLSVIIILCLIYLVLGCFLEGISMILITVPVVLPLILSFGFDPVWFGILLVILIEIGLITPPLGLNLFVIKAVCPELQIWDIYKGAFPFLIAPLVLIVMMIAWPEFVLWLPGMIK